MERRKQRGSIEKKLVSFREGDTAVWDVNYRITYPLGEGLQHHHPWSPPVWVLPEQLLPSVIGRMGTSSSE